MLPPLLAFGALTACAPADDATYTVPTDATAFWYAPAEDFTTFPDDLHTISDDATPTGLRVHFIDEASEWLATSVPENFTLVEALEQLDGFGTVGGIVLRFTGPIDPGGITTETLRFVQLSGEEATPDIEWEITWTDEGETAIVYPLFPLNPATRYGLVVAGELVDEDGERVWSSEDLWNLVHGTSVDSRLTAMESRYADLLEATDVEPDDVIAATVWTTQSIHEDEEAALAILEGNAADLQPLGCYDEEDIAYCEATLTALDLLGEDMILAEDFALSPAAEGTYELAVSLFLPTGDAAPQGPYPVIVYGHGLGGDRGEGGGLARDLAGLGLAVVSIDAPVHGDHPSATEEEEFWWIFQFFGVDLNTIGFEVLRLRDHWRAAAWDKFQLVEAIRAGVDVNGDGTNDLDGEQIFYSGHSLGGMMGPQLLALEPGIRAADLSVPGGRVAEIVLDGETFAPLVALMAPEDTSEGEIRRFFPMLQAAIERGDPANHAGAVLDGQRDVLVQMVVDDLIVPNSTTRVLARALGVPHADPVLHEVEGLEFAGALPLSGNVSGRTAALYQYDQRVDEDSWTLEPATHELCHGNPAGVEQLRHWWSTRIELGTAELIDPFPALGF